MIDTARYTHTDLDIFADYVLGVLERMADNRDIQSDRHGAPLISSFEMRHTATRLQVDLEADLSGIGMPVNTPLTAVQTRDEPHVSWWLNDVLISTTPAEWPPERAGDTLEMNALLTAFQTWVARSVGRGRGR